MHQLPSTSGSSRSTSGSRRGRRRSSAAPVEDVTVYGITSARRSQQADVSTRARRYMVSMTIRLVCFVLAFVFYGHWFAWVAAAGAVVLPYVAVLMANAGRERKAEPPTAMMPAGTGAGNGGPGAGPAPRSIGAVPSRTTPARDPWADARHAPPSGGVPGAGWQHPYADPRAPRAHPSSAATRGGAAGPSSAREKRRAPVS